MGLNTLAIVQARMGSTRFPGKIIKSIKDKSVIEILLNRLSKSKKIDKIVIATSKNKNNDNFVDLVENLGFEVYRGSEENVLNRFYMAAKKFNANTVVRITGDCPLVDPELVDDIINFFEERKVDYVSNVDPPTFPDGLDVEIFTFSSLKEAEKKSRNASEREHVTAYIRKNKKNNTLNFQCDKDYSSMRLTIDEPQDFEVIKNIIFHFYPNYYFKWKDIIELNSSHPEYFLPNSDIQRNEGSKLGKGQKLYKRAKKIIPGGTMLLSKRPEMFLPELWPSYFSRAKDCHVWDLDGKKYDDLSIMGIGTNTLGYGHPEVDESVRKAVEKGNMSTFNCPEEVYLAEKLINMHPWSDMVRFARTGGEANSIAVRIARSATEKHKIAICGYHGWHDWYLSANLNDNSNLDGHLLPGLNPKGVPRKLIGTTLPFEYNNLDSLEKLVIEQNVGIVKMEVSRTFEPDKNYLKSVRDLCDKHDLILIFDECTSGFRETFGGIHKKYGVNPDIMMLGKTLGNGYAITSVLGRKEIMKHAEDTFISSTFWTERIGPVAALKTLEIMERESSWEKITNIGKDIGYRWNLLANKYNIPIQISGLPALINFSFPLNDWIKYKTYITQELLKKNILGANSVYVSIKHNKTIVDNYFHELEIIFNTIAECENGRSIDELLDGPIAHGGFKRLN